jgi:hypothetical protein
MHAALITFDAGETLQVLVLAQGSDFMRIAVPGRRDAVELRMEGNQWLCDGEKVEVESLLAEDETAIPRFTPAGRTRTAQG